MCGHACCPFYNVCVCRGGVSVNTPDDGKPIENEMVCTLCVSVRVCVSS